MSIKRATNSHQQLNLKKLSKPLEEEQNHRLVDHLDGYQLGGRKERMGKMV